MTDIVSTWYFLFYCHSREGGNPVKWKKSDFLRNHQISNKIKRQSITICICFAKDLFIAMSEYTDIRSWILDTQCWICAGRWSETLILRIWILNSLQWPFIAVVKKTFLVIQDNYFVVQTQNCNSDWRWREPIYCVVFIPYSRMVFHTCFGIKF